MLALRAQGEHAFFVAFFVCSIFWWLLPFRALWPLHSSLPMDGGAWWAAVHGVAKNRTRLRDFTFAFHFHALEKAMATPSRVLAWRIPGTGKPGGLPSGGSHRVGHNWSDLAAAAAASSLCTCGPVVSSLCLSSYGPFSLDLGSTRIMSSSQNP